MRLSGARRASVSNRLLGFTDERRHDLGKLLTPQTALFHAPVEKDVVYTPDWLADLVVRHFAPTGRVLDPCRGDGAFYRLLPGADMLHTMRGSWSHAADRYDSLIWQRRLQRMVRWQGVPVGSSAR